MLPPLAWAPTKGAPYLLTINEIHHGCLESPLLETKEGEKALVLISLPLNSGDHGHGHLMLQHQRGAQRPY